MHTGWVPTIAEAVILVADAHGVALQSAVQLGVGKTMAGSGVDLAEVVLAAGPPVGAPANPLPGGSFLPPNMGK